MCRGGVACVFCLDKGPHELKTKHCMNVWLGCSSGPFDGRVHAWESCSGGPVEVLHLHAPTHLMQIQIAAHPYTCS